MSPTDPGAPPVRTGRPRASGRTLAGAPRDEIVAAATRLFAQGGVAGTTMSAIAEASGLRQSSVYYYFRDKDAILAEILSTVNRAVLEHLRAVNAEGGSPALRLYRFIRADARQLCAFPYDINEVYRIPTLRQRRFRSFWRDRQRLNDEVAALIAEGVASGELRDVDPRLAALTILANDEGAQNWFRMTGVYGQRGGEDYSPEDAGTFLADLALGALLARRSRLGALRAHARRIAP